MIKRIKNSSKETKPMTVRVEGSRDDDNGDRIVYERPVDDAVKKAVEKELGKKHKFQGAIFGGSGMGVLSIVLMYLLGINPITGVKNTIDKPATEHTLSYDKMQISNNSGELKALSGRVSTIERESDRLKTEFESMVKLENLRHSNENKEFELYKSYIDKTINKIDSHLESLDKKINP